MSPRLPSVRPADLVRALERDGWVNVRQHGSHVQLRKEGNPQVISVAIHNRDIKSGTLRGILRDADLSTDRFVELLRQ